MLGIKVETVLFGALVGLLIGFTGIGGGSIMTPLLIIALGVAPVTAIGTDLAYGAVTKTFGAVNHLRRRNIDFRVYKWLALGSLPGTLLGVILVGRLRASYGHRFEDVLLGVVGGALLIVAIVVLLRTMLPMQPDRREGQRFEFTTGAKLAAVLLGLFLGTILGLTSVGTGALIGVAMMLVFRLTPQRTAGTSVFLGACLLWVAAIGYLAIGQVDFTLMGNILIGSIPGVWVGSLLVNRVADQALRVTLAAVLLGSALASLGKAGASMPTTAIIGAPLGVGALGWLTHRRRARPALGAGGARARTGGGIGVGTGTLAAGTTRLRPEDH